MINIPNEIKESIKYLKSYDEFIPLIAFGNVLKCIHNREFFIPPEARIMTNSLAANIKVNENVTETNFEHFKFDFNTFEDFYMPGNMLIPDF